MEKGRSNRQNQSPRLYIKPDTRLEITEYEVVLDSSRLTEYQCPWSDPCHVLIVALISAMDTSVGNLTAILKDAGQLENTLIIFTSDVSTQTS